jgi:hypothetical protein
VTKKVFDGKKGSNEEKRKGRKMMVRGKEI